jgi:hypothetical protein
MLAGFVLFMRFSILSCFSFMDWQFIFRILRGGFLGDFFARLTFLSGVDKWRGLSCCWDLGLRRLVLDSDSALNDLDVDKE